VVIRAIAAFALALAGCNQAARSENFSCWMGNVCEDYTADLPAHEHACKAMRAEWEKHACPKENLVGTCVTDAHQSRMYYGGTASAFTSDTASTSCEHEFHGTWTSVK
jgi:hypothetical protein